MEESKSVPTVRCCSSQPSAFWFCWTTEIYIFMSSHKPQYLRDICTSAAATKRTRTPLGKGWKKRFVIYNTVNCHNYARTPSAKGVRQELGRLICILSPVQRKKSELHSVCTIIIFQCVLSSTKLIIESRNVLGWKEH